MAQPCLVKLARAAMGTRFEVVLYGEDPVRLRAAGEEALAEIERLDRQLSLYRPDSELRGLNARAAQGPVAVEPRLFRLLQRAAQLGAETDGAFDLTVTPLLECWGFVGGTGAYPDPAAVEAAREVVGWSLLELASPPPPPPSHGGKAGRFTVRFRRPGVRLDCGAIGKGYALERAALLLRDNGVDCALLHGGTSTVYGLGAPPDAAGWTVAINPPLPSHKARSAERGAWGMGHGAWGMEHGAWSMGHGAWGMGHRVPTSDFRLPTSDFRLPTPNPESLTSNPEPAPLASVPLRDCALSVSAVTGKSFVHEGQRFGHVLDPRTGFPVQGVRLAAVVLDSPTEADAWSTALLVLGEAGLALLRERRPEAKALLAHQGDTAEDLDRPWR